MGRLANKTALITGASRGIGLAIARRFAAEGAAVVLCASRWGAPRQICRARWRRRLQLIQDAGGRAAGIACDLGQPDARADLVQQAGAHFGPVDIIVNNAAVSENAPAQRSHDRASATGCSTSTSMRRSTWRSRRCPVCANAAAAGYSISAAAAPCSPWCRIATRSRGPCHLCLRRDQGGAGSLHAGPGP